jgi:hypothetical protein
MAEQQPPVSRAGVWFISGVLAGAALGYIIPPCLRLIGQPAGMCPSVYVGFWGLVGGFAGLIAAFVRWLIARRN